MADDMVQVRTLRDPRRARRPGRRPGPRRRPGRRPRGRARRPAGRTAGRGRAGGGQPVVRLPMEGWDGEPDGRPTDLVAPPLAALRRGGGGHRVGRGRPRCGPTGGPTPASWSSTTPPSTPSARCAATWWPPTPTRAARRRAGRRPPAHPLGPLEPARRRAAARASPTATRCSTPGGLGAGPAATRPC